MRFTAKEIVRGVTRFHDTIDGKEIKSAFVFVDVSLDKEGRGWGHRTNEMKCKDLAVIDAIKQNPFPFEAELEIEQIAGRKTAELVVVGIKPLKRVPQAA